MDDQEKENRRKRQVKKMTKIITKAWNLPHAEHFQQWRLSGTTETGTADGSSPLDLTGIGQTLDAGGYHLGRHGWEKFASDIGGVYNRFLRYVYLSFWLALSFHCLVSLVHLCDNLLPACHCAIESDLYPKL